MRDLSEDRFAYLSYFWWLEKYEVARKKGDCALCSALHHDISFPKHQVTEYWHSVGYIKGKINVATLDIFNVTVCHGLKLWKKVRIPNANQCTFLYRLLRIWQHIGTQTLVYGHLTHGVENLKNTNVSTCFPVFACAKVFQIKNNAWQCCTVLIKILFLDKFTCSSSFWTGVNAFQGHSIEHFFLIFSHPFLYNHKSVLFFLPAVTASRRSSIA